MKLNETLVTFVAFIILPLFKVTTGASGATISTARGVAKVLPIVVFPAISVRTTRKSTLTPDAQPLSSSKSVFAEPERLTVNTFVLFISEFNIVLVNAPTFTNSFVPTRACKIALPPSRVASLGILTVTSTPVLVLLK